MSSTPCLPSSCLYKEECLGVLWGVRASLWKMLGLLMRGILLYVHSWASCDKVADAVYAVSPRLPAIQPHPSSYISLLCFHSLGWCISVMSLLMFKQLEQTTFWPRDVFKLVTWREDVAIFKMKSLFRVKFWQNTMLHFWGAEAAWWPNVFMCL